MAQYNKRPGRPKMPEEDRIQYRISAKFSLKEILSLKKKAESDGISLYEYMRQALLTAEVHAAPLRIFILECAEDFDNLVEGGDGVHAQLLPDFVELHNIQHLEADAVDE